MIDLSPAGRRVWTPGSRALPQRTLAEQVTDRRRQILTLVALGLTNAQIGRLLGLHQRTVGRHLDDVRAVLGAADRTQAVVLAYQHNLIDLPAPVVAAEVRAQPLSTVAWCRRWHPLTPANTFAHSTSGCVMCRACHRLTSRQRRAKYPRRAQAAAGEGAAA